MSDPSLRGRYSPVVAHTDSFANPIWLFLPSALASYKKSSQVATSPCCQRDLPDVISANPSSDAWSLATAVPRSAFTCFFLRVIGLPHEVMGRLPATVREYDFSRVAFSTLRHSLMFRPPRLLVPQVVPTAANVPQGSRDFYIRAERASLPRHAPDMLAVRIQVIDGARTSTLQDLQPCRLLPLHLLQPPDILCANDTPMLATVRRSNRACSFPAHGFHEDSCFRDAIEGIS